MGIEINRARVAADGRVTCEMVFPNIGSFTRSANEVLRIEADAFAPVEPTAPAFSSSEEIFRAKLRAAGLAGLRVPRASVPPFVGSPDIAPHQLMHGDPSKFSRGTALPVDTTLGGQPLPPAVEALAERQNDEMPLNNGEAYQPHEFKVGGTSSE